MALSADRNTLRKDGVIISLKVYQAVTIYAGSLVALNATGYAVPAADTANLRVIGVAEEQVDNSSGASGALSVKVRRGASFKLANSVGDALTQAYIGKPCYVEDDQTVANTGSNLVTAGVVQSIESDGVYVLIPVERVNDSVNIDISDAGEYFTGTEVETALQELAAADAAHLADAADAHDASAISVADAGEIITATEVEAALQELATAAAAHLADAADAHDASAISIVDAGAFYTGTEVEAALQEVGAARGRMVVQHVHDNYGGAAYPTDITADAEAEVAFIAPRAGVISVAGLAVSECGADGTDPLFLELDVLINAVSIFTTKPKIDQAAGATAANTLAAGAGITQGVIDITANILAAGDIVTVTYDLTRTTPEDEMAGPIAIIEVEEVINL